MKKSKAKFWMVLWLIISILLTALSRAEQVVYYLQNGSELKYPPFTILQLISLLGILPFVLIPALVQAFRHAKLEKIKWIKILSGVLIVHHIIFAIASLLAAIGLI